MWLTGGDNNVFTQISFLVLAALACKNAILIVEFARRQEMAGTSRKQAILDASHTRLRPILMTSIAFIMGVLPLVFSSGAGAEVRQAMGIAVFAGMLGVTLFGLFMTPVFYSIVGALAARTATAVAIARSIAVAHGHGGIVMTRRWWLVALSVTLAGCSLRAPYKRRSWRRWWSETPTRRCLRTSRTTRAGGGSSRTLSSRNSRTTC